MGGGRKGKGKLLAPKGKRKRPPTQGKKGKREKADPHTLSSNSTRRPDHAYARTNETISRLSTPQTPLVSKIRAKCPYHRRLGGAQPGNRFVSFVRAYARSGCLVELELNVCGPPFSFFPFWPGELSLFPFGLGGFPLSLPPNPPIQL